MAAAALGAAAAATKHGHLTPWRLPRHLTAWRLRD